jgi:drug/metabolite transporter (DMT)-like permease
MIWGSTFLAIKYQLGRIDPMVSVIYRFGLSAAFLASLGNITSARNTKNNIPVIQANAYGMVCGVVFGSIIAFGAYLTLIGSIGADKAAYTIMVVPVIALILSSFFENYTWNPLALIGLAFVLSGNYLALKKTSLPLTGQRLIRVKRSK